METLFSQYRNLPRLLAAVLLGFFCAMPARAMEASSLNRPPIAAPVDRIAVGALPVVRSQSEIIEDVLSGLVPGLMAGHPSVSGVAFLAVSADHVAMRKDFGAAQPQTSFDAGSLGDIPIAIALMQQMEKGNLLPTQNVAGSTVEEILTYQTETAPVALLDEITRISGQPSSGYLSQRVFVPLKMSNSVLTSSGFVTSLADMGQLTIALLNGGAAGEARVLEPASIGALQRTQMMPHPAIPGSAYGFAEMRRNGWRALHHDGKASGIEARLVLVPEARLGYFVLVRGSGGAGFWRTFDNTLFDRLFPVRDAAITVPAGVPAPNAEFAAYAAGAYGAKASVASLKTGGVRLDIAARDDASLELTGAENAVLLPREGGYWSTENGALSAVYRNGLMHLSSGTYAPLPPWFRWDMYLLLAFGVAFVAAGIFTFEGRRARAVYVPGTLALSFSALSGALALAALLFWLLAPAP